MKLALAHDYLIQMGGAERVVAAMHGRFPDVPIYTSAVDRLGLWPELRAADIRTTWMQGLPLIDHHTHFKKYVLLYPLAFRSMKAAKTDVAWISSSAFAKFLRFPPETRTVCYLHNTTRFLWQTDAYVAGEVRSKSFIRALGLFLPRLRKMDREATARMNVLIANSQNVRQRIQKHYGLESEVINPPVNTERFEICSRDDGCHLVVSRLLVYKNIELPVRAFTDTGRKLIVVGDGPDRTRLEGMAGPSVRFMGRLSDDEISRLYSGCRAFLLPGEEDFGITPLEAMACGKPVIALARGGALETIVDGKTGILFRDPTPQSLLAAVSACEATRWDQEAIRTHSLSFSTERFLEKMQRIVETQYADFGGRRI